MLLAAGALLLFFVTYQRRLLQQQRRLHAIETGHQQQVLSAIIDAQEGERERIGQDLHDGIGSTVATAKLLVNRLGKLPPAESPAELLALIEKLMNAAVQDVRSIAHNLYPAVLARYGLAEALQHLVDVCNETGTLPIELNVAYARPLAQAQELALYRICQELIHNALKHARGATRLLVHLRQQAASLTLTVEDNGCGISTPLAPSSGAGLRSIGVRVQLLQATLQQQSAPGQGLRTVITCRPPILG